MICSSFSPTFEIPFKKRAHKLSNIRSIALLSLWTWFQVTPFPPLSTAAPIRHLTDKTHSSPPEWAAQFLGDHQQTLLPYTPYVRLAYSYLHLAQAHLLALLDQVSRKPDLATIALLLIILFVSLRLLNMLWQTLLFWVRLARALAFWGGLLALALWVHARGVAGVRQDVEYWWGVWGREYEYWRENESVARMARGRGRGSWY